METHRPGASERIRHDRGHANALEAVIDAAACHLADKLQSYREGKHQQVSHETYRGHAAHDEGGFVITSLTELLSVCVGLTKSVTPKALPVTE